jgi:hypothetical protein
MNQFVKEHLRAGLMAGSLCLALVLGAAAQSTKPESQPAQPSAAPSQTAPGQTLPDQDNGVRPAPDKDNAAQQPANPQDRDRDRDHDAMSQTSTSGDNAISKEEVKEFDQFLDKHPQIAQDLQKDPQKANDATYISSHPEFSQWLDKHPKIQEQLKKDPSSLMSRTQQYEKQEDKQKTENPR